MVRHGKHVFSDVSDHRALLFQVAGLILSVLCQTAGTEGKITSAMRTRGRTKAVPCKRRSVVARRGRGRCRGLCHAARGPRRQAPEARGRAPVHAAGARDGKCDVGGAALVGLSRETFPGETAVRFPRSTFGLGPHVCFHTDRTDRCDPGSSGVALIFMRGRIPVRKGDPPETLAQKILSV